MRKTRAPIGHMCVERQGRYKMKNSNKLRALEGLKICNEVGSPPPHTHCSVILTNCSITRAERRTQNFILKRDEYLVHLCHAHLKKESAHGRQAFGDDVCFHHFKLHFHLQTTPEVTRRTSTMVREAAGCLFAVFAVATALPNCCCGR